MQYLVFSSPFFFPHRVEFEISWTEGVTICLLHPEHKFSLLFVTYFRHLMVPMNFNDTYLPTYFDIVTTLTHTAPSLSLLYYSLLIPENTN